MKILSILALTVLLASSCENGLTGGVDDHTLAGVLSAASDPVADCPIETAHYHNGLRYAGHYVNDGCASGHHDSGHE